MNKKLFKFSLVLCASILMAISCSSNSKPDEKKDWNGPTLPEGSKHDSPLDITIPNNSTDISVEIPVTVSSSVKDVSFKFVSGIEVDEQGADKTAQNAAKLAASDIVANSFKYENGKIIFSISKTKSEELNEKKMRLGFKVTSSSHKDYNLNVFVYFKQAVGAGQNN